MPTSNHLRTKPADFSLTSLQRAWSQPSAAYLAPQIEAAAAATRCSFAC